MYEECVLAVLVVMREETWTRVERWTRSFARSLACQTPPAVVVATASTAQQQRVVERDAPLPAISTLPALIARALAEDRRRDPSDDAAPCLQQPHLTITKAREGSGQWAMGNGGWASALSLQRPQLSDSQLANRPNSRAQAVAAVNFDLYVPSSTVDPLREGRDRRSAQRHRATRKHSDAARAVHEEKRESAGSGEDAQGAQRATTNRRYEPSLGFACFAHAPRLSRAFDACVAGHEYSVSERQTALVPRPRLELDATHFIFLLLQWPDAPEG